MNSRQERLRIAIDRQRRIVASHPQEPDEQRVLWQLYKELRSTFHVVKDEPLPRYALSQSGAVLKRVF